MQLIFLILIGYFWTITFIINLELHPHSLVKCYEYTLLFRVDTRVSLVQNFREFHVKRVSYFAKKILLVSRNFLFRETGVRWVCVLSVCGEFIWRLCVLSVSGECVWWVCLVSLFGECEWWVYVVSVCGECVWWFFLVTLWGECLWWVYEWAEEYL